MQTWFECKVKYMKIDQGGHERKVNDSYLLDAVSFTDAETRIFQQMQVLTNGEFQVVNIKKSNITEIISDDNGEWWYKAKISLITIDEEAGREKKVNNYVLVMADDINDGLKKLEKGLEYMLVPYVVTSIALSPIAEVFPYFEDEELKDKVVARTIPEPEIETESDELDELDNLEEIEPIESETQDDEEDIIE